MAFSSFEAFRDMIPSSRSGVLVDIRRHERPNLSEMWNKASQDSLRIVKTNGIMDSPSVPQTPLEKKRALRPVIKDHHHQDSLFGNSFNSKSFFVVHPEWLSEAVDNTDPQPLHRPPWPWEQPRYRQNIQIPITYKSDEQEPEVKDEKEVEEDECKTTPPPLPYAVPIGYTFTHPSIDDARPTAKMTQFGAPIVDTSNYKLSF